MTLRQLTNTQPHIIEANPNKQKTAVKQPKYKRCPFTLQKTTSYSMKDAKSEAKRPSFTQRLINC